MSDMLWPKLKLDKLSSNSNSDVLIWLQHAGHFIRNCGTFEHKILIRLCTIVYRYLTSSPFLVNPYLFFMVFINT